MGRWIARLGDERVSIDCSDARADLVPPVLEMLSSLHERGEPMDEGLTLRWGWSALILVRMSDGRLQVHEPDFDDDPLEHVRADVTTTLQVQAASRDLLARCGCVPVPFAFDDALVVAGDALAQPVLMAQRSESSAPGDSGWYLGARPGFEHTEPAPRMAFELLTTRPALLPALALPTGWQVVLEGERITRVVDDSDRDVVRDR